MESKEIKIAKGMNDFLVIGLGRFGITAATTLAQLGHQVLAVDKEAKNLKEVENVVSSAVAADCSSIEVLKSLGAQNFDCAIVAIGESFESSVLITSFCKQLGIGFIVAKAQSEQQKIILEEVGANIVIFPEVYMGKKIASILDEPSVNRLLDLSHDVNIVEIAMPESWAEKTIGELNVRKKAKVSIIYIKRGNEVITPDAETVLEAGDRLIIGGQQSAIDSLSGKVAESIDIKNVIGDALGIN
ncbi:MAG: TrkA family potassium uptake protein [Clostridia bacterium]|jgi:trk system potassium uptake protein TrkA|nr:TrkA family potassium uptake protein [Clostridia bacterium]